MEEDRPVRTFRSAVDIQNRRVFFSGLVVSGSQYPAIDLLIAISVTMILCADIFGLRDIFAAECRGIEPGHLAQAALLIRMINLLQFHVIEPHHPKVAPQ